MTLSIPSNPYRKSSPEPPIRTLSKLFPMIWSSYSEPIAFSIIQVPIVLYAIVYPLYTPEALIEETKPPPPDSSFKVAFLRSTLTEPIESDASITSIPPVSQMEV